jgi:hypothetical protein
MDASSHLRELNHRVKNNLQIIVSLMNLKKLSLPDDRREDIRFLQEHVHCMAVAYRLIYDTSEASEVSISELLSEAISELRQIARLDLGQVRVVGGTIDETVGLDQAIAFGLYLAVVLPPYLDRARSLGGHVVVAASVEARQLTLSIAGSWGEPVESDLLRSRLSDAYIGQLQATPLPSSDPSDRRCRLPLDRMTPIVPIGA